MVARGGGGYNPLVRLITYEVAARTRAGIVRGEEVFPLDFPDVGAMLAAGVTRPEPKGALVPLASVWVRAPILRPPKIIAVGLNYRDHAAEQGKPLPTSPILFAKAATSVIGPDEAILLPRAAPSQVDPEVELAAVIGPDGGIFGWTILNDVSARDVQREEKQWFRAKSFPTFAPMGPAVVTADELGEAPDLAISLSVSGERRQASRTSQLVFAGPALRAFVADSMRLEPGDVISTGTPGGVGVFRNPPVFLKDGDVVECAVERIGTLRNPVRAA